MAIQKIAKIVAIAAVLSIPFVFYPGIYYGDDEYLFQDRADLVLHKVPDSDVIEKDGSFSFADRVAEVGAFFLFAVMFALSFLLVPVSLRTKHDPSVVRFERKDRYVFHEGNLYRKR